VPGFERLLDRGSCIDLDLSMIALFLVLALGQPTSEPGAIVIAGDAAPPVRAAGALLARELSAVLGRDLAVSTATAGGAVLVGRSAVLDARHPGLDWKGLGTEGYLLETAGGDLIVAGATPRATLYAAHALLDGLGRRVFSTRCVQAAPRRSDLPELHVRSVPPLEYRECLFTDALLPEFTLAHRLNGSNHEISDANGGCVRYSHFVHTFHDLVPPDEYFDAHPEYFALVDGQRRRERAQLCLTNPDVLRIAIATVKSWIADAPEATIFSVSQNDCAGFCTCEACRAIDDAEESHAGSLLAFVNRVAEAIERDHPDRLIDTLAYTYTRKPPKTLRPRANVIVRLCSIECCFSHPLATCPRNAKFRDDLIGWSKLTDRLYIWDYVTNFAHYLLPLPNVPVLAANIRFFREHGVRGIFEEGNYSQGGGGEMNELKAYVIARALWDPGIDARQTQDEFLRGYYGAAAPPIARWLDRLAAETAPPERHAFIYDDATAAYLNADALRAGAQCFAEAERLAPDAVIRARVRTASLGVRYAELMRATGPERARLRAAFIADARAAGITNVGEMVTLDNFASHD
jgi:hypothetical protein